MLCSKSGVTERSEEKEEERGAINASFIAWVGLTTCTHTHTQTHSEKRKKKNKGGGGEAVVEY